MIKEPNQIAETIQINGEQKTRIETSRLLVLGILAGAYIGFGAQIATIVSVDATQYVGLGIARIITGTVFSVGLILVILGGAELFTGNCLIWLSVIGGKVKTHELVRNLSIVYLGNFLGSVLLAYIIMNTGSHWVGSNTLGVTAISIANAKVNLTFTEAFYRGVACNWLVCLAIWLAASSESVSGKILSCIFPIMTFVGSGYEHSVANMFFIPMGIMLKDIPGLITQTGLDTGNLNWVQFILRNLIPVTLGNIIGGGFFVATLYGYIYTRKTNLAPR